MQQQRLPVVILRVSNMTELGTDASGRQFRLTEKLSSPERKQIVQILDAFLGSEKVKKAG